MTLLTLIDAMASMTQAQADLALDTLAQQLIDCGEFPDIDMERAREITRRDLAYFTGRYPDDVRRRVEQLFQCAHPIFGAIDANGPPTAEQAFKLGEVFGEPGYTDEQRLRFSFHVPRVDAERAGHETTTGIFIRAIGGDGKWDSYDIVEVTRDSLLGWLQTLDKQATERVVLLLLGHVQVEAP